MRASDHERVTPKVYAGRQLPSTTDKNSRVHFRFVKWTLSHPPGEIHAIRSGTEVSRGRPGDGRGRFGCLGGRRFGAAGGGRSLLRPSGRDFAATDEALRLRLTGLQGSITYKGPKIDAVTKTRREIELPLGELREGTTGWRELLEALGFRPVAEVRKLRRKAFVSWQDRRIEISLDVVEQVGTFVELELMAGPPDLAAAKACIAALADRLGLTRSERRSYLELLLGRKATA